MNKAPIKPCPACGCKTCFQDGYSFSARYWVECGSVKCKVNGPVRKTPRSAIAAWDKMPRRER